MATKIRLQRHGRKSYAFYQIVVADSRAPRDGKFIERIGSYNPNTNPATVDLNFERALYWLQVGAQPTDTTRNILSREGVCMKKHLLEGVKKGAFDEATAESKFQTWLKNKQASVEAVKSKDSEAAKAAEKARLEAEKEANKAKAEEVAKKKAELAAAAAAKAAEEAAANAPAEEAPAADRPGGAQRPAPRGAENRHRPEEGPGGEAPGGGGRLPPVRQQAGVDGHRRAAGDSPGASAHGPAGRRPVRHL